MQEDNLVVFSLIPAETTLCVDLRVLWVVQGLHKLRSSLQLPVASDRESWNSGVKIHLSFLLIRTAAVLMKVLKSFCRSAKCL